MTQQEQEELVRSERFGRLFDTLKNIESDMPLLIANDANVRLAGRSGTNFYNNGPKPGLAKANTRDEKTAESNLQNYLWTTPQNTFN